MFLSLNGMKSKGQNKNGSSPNRRCGGREAVLKSSHLAICFTGLRDLVMI